MNNVLLIKIKKAIVEVSNRLKRSIELSNILFRQNLSGLALLSQLPSIVPKINIWTGFE